MRWGVTLPTPSISRAALPAPALHTAGKVQAALVDLVGWRLLHTVAAAVARQRLCLSVEGLEHIPPTGPVLIASRHFHHLYDGCALLASIPRPTSIMVGLDWVQDRRIRGLMEWACDTARWPAVLRRDRMGGPGQPPQGQSAYRADEVDRYLRRAIRLAASLLRRGRVLVVFPEAYPNVDPVFTPKQHDDDFLPFRDGFARLVRLAQRGGRARVPIVPAGLCYRRGARWQITLRFGPPLFVGAAAGDAELTSTLEAQVRQLSGYPPDPPHLDLPPLTAASPVPQTALAK